MKNKKLKLARVEKDLSQAELAELVGVTRQTIGLDVYKRQQSNK